MFESFALWGFFTASLFSVWMCISSISNGLVTKYYGDVIIGISLLYINFSMLKDMIESLLIK